MRNAFDARCEREGKEKKTRKFSLPQISLSTHCHGQAQHHAIERSTRDGSNGKWKSSTKKIVGKWMRATSSVEIGVKFFGCFVDKYVWSIRFLNMLVNASMSRLHGNVAPSQNATLSILSSSSDEITKTNTARKRVAASLSVSSVNVYSSIEFMSNPTDFELHLDARRRSQQKCM